jgi:hypothetical protein
VEEVYFMSDKMLMENWRKYMQSDQQLLFERVLLKEGAMDDALDVLKKLVSSDEPGQRVSAAQSKVMTDAILNLMQQNPVMQKIEGEIPRYATPNEEMDIESDHALIEIYTLFQAYEKSRDTFLRKHSWLYKVKDLVGKVAGLEFESRRGKWFALALSALVLVGGGFGAFLIALGSAGFVVAGTAMMGAALALGFFTAFGDFTKKTLDSAIGFLEDRYSKEAEEAMEASFEWDPGILNLVEKYGLRSKVEDDYIDNVLRPYLSVEGEYAGRGSAIIPKISEYVRSHSEEYFELDIPQTRALDADYWEFDPERNKQLQQQAIDAQRPSLSRRSFLSLPQAAESKFHDNWRNFLLTEEKK